MLEVKQLTCVRGDRRLFSDLNFTATPGELVEVRGPNGSGKTSLLRIICGLAAPDEGEVRWNGDNIRSLREEYFSSVAYVAHQNGVKDELNVVENVIISAGVAGQRLNRTEAELLLERVGLTKQAHLPARFLSAGQKRRLALTRLPASRATLWVLDEVTASLDDDGMALASAIVSDHLKSGGMAVVAAHHDFGLPTDSMTKITLSQ